MEINMKNAGIKISAVLLAATLVIGCYPKRLNDPIPRTDTITKEQVRDEFLHAWDAYEKYAWGHDALRPLSKQPVDWYEHTLLMTPVDAFDTMVIMGLDEQVKQTKTLIFESLNFDLDMEVRHFEITIRILGGLISAYQLDGDERFLELAIDLAERMLPAFDSPTGMPYRMVNLRTGETSGNVTNPAEIGTYIIEYGALSKITGNEIYYRKAKKALVALYERRSEIGLIGSMINIETGKWTIKDSQIGGGADSYYEYLLKGWLLFEDEDLKIMWDNSILAMNTYLADESKGDLWYGNANMNSGQRTLKVFGALHAFFPGLLALGGDIDRAERLELSCYKMWVLHGIEPELINYQNMMVLVGNYNLRPEIIESAYYLYHYTGDKKYQDMGVVFFNSLINHCKADEGYSALLDVRLKIKSNYMESYFLAETLKYFYLLFAEPEEFDFNKVIFNTEAHPIFKTWE